MAKRSIEDRKVNNRMIDWHIKWLFFKMHKIKNK